MAQTLSSSTTLFCTVAEFLKRVDKTAVAKLASDTGTPVPEGNLGTDANVLAALRDASGEVESAAMQGGRYLAADFTTILATDCNARGKLYRVVSDIAWALLWERRPNKEMKPPPSLERSMLWLDMLSKGTKIFPFTETENAGVMERVEASVDDVDDRNGAVYQARSYYGVRSDRVSS